jgi:hypothetical protein
MPRDYDYVTIRSPDGALLYDSRTEVPCDKEKFDATAKRCANEWGVRLSRRV